MDKPAESPDIRPKNSTALENVARIMGAAANAGVKMTYAESTDLIAFDRAVSEELTKMAEKSS